MNTCGEAHIIRGAKLYVEKDPDGQTKTLANAQPKLIYLTRTKNGHSLQKLG
jgi:hypothetical protein